MELQTSVWRHLGLQQHLFVHHNELLTQFCKLVNGEKGGVSGRLIYANDQIMSLGMNN